MTSCQRLRRQWGCGIENDHMKLPVIIFTVQNNKNKVQEILKKKIKRKQNNNALAEFIFLLLLRSFPANVCEVSLIPAQTDEAGKQDKRLSVRSIIINNFRCRQITITDSLRNKRRGFLCSRILLRTQTFLDLNASAHAQKWKFQLNNN